MSNYPFVVIPDSPLPEHNTPTEKLTAFIPHQCQPRCVILRIVLGVRGDGAGIIALEYKLVVQWHTENIPIRSFHFKGERAIYSQGVEKYCKEDRS